MSVYAAAMAPMDGVTGCIFTDANGVIRMRELVDLRWWYRPGAPVVFLGHAAEFTAVNMRSGVQTESDNAPGLTTAVGARKNWSQFTDADFVSDLDTVPPAIRAQFKRECQLQSTTSLSMSASYTHAINAPAMTTLFDNIDVAAVLRDRTLYSYSTLVDPPKFTRFTVYFGDVDRIPILYFGDYVRITYDRFGFGGAGQLRAVVDTVYWPHAGQVEILAWGGQ